MSQTARRRSRAGELEDLTQVFDQSPALVHPLADESLAERRRFARELSDIVAAQVAPPIDPTVTIAGEQIAGLPIRSYTPGGWDTNTGPLLVFLHGGGFVFGEPHELINDSLLSNRARSTGVRILSLGYSLAPEFPFPAARDEATRVWLALRAAHPAVRMGLGGVSAGAAISISTVLELTASGAPLPDYLLLEVPPAGPDPVPAEQDLAGADPHPGVREQWAIYPLALAAYRGRPGDRLLSSDSPDPLRLPPTLILMAEHDALRPGAEALAARLHAAGTAVTSQVISDTIHGSIGATRRCQAAREWEAVVAGWLAQPSGPDRAPSESAPGVSPSSEPGGLAPFAPGALPPSEGEHHAA
ncbi:alpha/beta hydrolase [Galactobacter caseinivorans]|uniref:Alpha/beta hydrolase n=1 Tax=Galactobacter caseinivorans TaxID=2676123 RepID=A0A496PM18_9MICC|nr:alpha/beta hydrolase [Galactobacter caseinivorans]